MSMVIRQWQIRRSWSSIRSLDIIREHHLAVLYRKTRDHQLFRRITMSNLAICDCLTLLFEIDLWVLSKNPLASEETYWSLAIDHFMIHLNILDANILLRRMSSFEPAYLPQSHRIARMIGDLFFEFRKVFFCEDPFLDQLSRIHLDDMFEGEEN